MRVMGAVLASVMLIFAFAVQSNLICPAQAPAHHQAPCDKGPAKSQTPMCCWDLATCTAPAVPATHTADIAMAPLDRAVSATSIGLPPSIVFAPETPPPKA
jgi:hypothetical protein